MHVDELVADGVAVQRAVFVGRHERQDDVVVAEQSSASEHRVTATRQQRGPQVSG